MSFYNIKNVKLVSSFNTSHGLIELRLFDKTNVDKVKSEVNVFGEESIIRDPLERKDVYFSLIAKNVPTYSLNQLFWKCLRRLILMLNLLYASIKENYRFQS